MYSTSGKDEVVIKIIGKLTLEFPELDQIKVRNVIEEVLYKYDVLPQETSLVASDIDDKLSMYLAVRRLEGLSERTLKNTNYEIVKFSQHVIKPLITVNTTDLRVYLAVRCKGLQQNTTNTVMSYIKKFFSWLFEEGYIPTNPAGRLKRTKEPKRIKQPLSKKEIEQLRLACTSLREKALINFLYATGCRLSEITNINKDDICWSERTLFVIGKGDKQREVCFDQAAELHLQNYLSSRTDSSDALFVTERRPYGRLGNRAIQKMIKNIAKRAGINKSVHPHLFRRTFATHKLNSGAPLNVVQGWLGHNNPATTQIYATTSRENLIHEYRRIS
ncbi:MAG: tyrosine-type recombinase/integrase [Bacteroidota bacterium]|nr:tyrosine-type recombinase/integrase [Bacteroidota bacterium]